MNHMPLKAIPTLLVAVILGAAVSTAAVSRAEVGFEHFHNLEYDQAIDAFKDEIAAAKNQPDGYNHLAQAILYRRLYEAGMLENSLTSGNDVLLSLIRQPKLVFPKEDEEAFQRALTAATEAARAKLRINPRDDSALYALGIAYSLRANYDFLVRKAWVSAIRAGNEALKLHKQVAALNPSRTDALLVVGLHDYAVASLPAGLRFLGAIAGVRGDKERGLETLRVVAERGQQNRVEAQILLSAFYRHEKRTEQTIPLLDSLLERFPRNYLLHFAKIYALIELKDGQNASESLRLLDANRNSHMSGYDRISLAQICRAKDQIQYQPVGGQEKHNGGHLLSCTHAALPGAVQVRIQ